MPLPDAPWPYLPTLTRLALALAIGLFIGIERERRRKEAGLRTFGFAAVLGALGGLLGAPYALLALALLGVLVVLLNLETIRTGEGAEITTSAALLVTGFTGLLAGQGHTFTPTALGVAVAALLAWKEPLAGFSQALTDRELRSAILLAILGFVVYPVLPTGAIDRWGLVEPRSAWITVILIAGLGFANYVLLKVYGAKGSEIGAFLGGLVNSTVTVAELADRARSVGSRFRVIAYRGIVLATAAMLVRNGVLLLLLAPAVFLSAALPLALMLIGILAVASRRGSGHEDGASEEPIVPNLSSPFSLVSALKFGAIFLALRVAGTLAQRALGEAGFYTVSVIGGVVSSASAVAAAANLAASGTLPVQVAATGALLAVVTSGLVTIPVVARVAEDRWLTRRVVWMLGCLVLFGAAGMVAQRLLPDLRAAALVPAGGSGEAPKPGS